MGFRDLRVDGLCQRAKCKELHYALHLNTKNKRFSFFPFHFLGDGRGNKSCPSINQCASTQTKTQDKVEKYCEVFCDPVYWVVSC